MKSFHIIVLALALACGDAAASPPKASAPPQPIPGMMPSIADALPDSVILARVEDRVLRVYDFRDRYFASDGQFRPRNDSTGKVTFLNSMVDKEVLSLTAREIKPPLSFEDRLKMREYTQTVLENTLYLRMVIDSIRITEEDIRAVYPQYGYEQHLRSILLADRITAEKLRLDLLRGRIAWREAVRRYSKTQDGSPDGDLGWIKRASLRSVLGLQAFALQPGSISNVIEDVEGFRILQCVERRAVTMPPATFMHGLVLEDLRAAGRAPRVEKMYDAVRTFAGVVYDTTNILWAAQQYKRAYAEQGADEGSIVVGGVMPEFSNEDTTRVLVRTRDRKITLGQFILEFSSVPAMFRQKIISLEPFIFALDGPALRPERVQFAYNRGIDKDPEAIRLIEQRREEFMVEHIYQDSVMNHVTVTPAMRRAYYKSRETEFVTLPRVRYARFLRPNLKEAEDLLARLQLGERAETIQMQDSLRGDDSTGTIEDVAPADVGEYRRILFEELKPGQSTKVGPDRHGKYLVFQVLRHDATRQMAYEEVQGLIDESLQNMEAERVLKEFLGRRRAHYRIESHPELLPKMRLTDPKLDVAIGETARKAD